MLESVYVPNFIPNGAFFHHFKGQNSKNRYQNLKIEFILGELECGGCLIWVIGARWEIFWLNGGEWGSVWIFYGLVVVGGD